MYSEITAISSEVFADLAQIVGTSTKCQSAGFSSAEGAVRATGAGKCFCIVPSATANSPGLPSVHGGRPPFYPRGLFAPKPPAGGPRGGAAGPGHRVLSVVAVGGNLRY